MQEWGADVLRVAVLFAAPSEKEIEWDGKLLKTVRKWLRSITEIPVLVNDGKQETLRLAKDITKCMQGRKFHVAIARLMEYSHLIKKGTDLEHIEEFLIMLYPFAPHIAAELYYKHFQTDIRFSKWPVKLDN